MFYTSLYIHVSVYTYLLYKYTKKIQTTYDVMKDCGMPYYATLWCVVIIL